jgi:uncharacterized repeat protein (TIGR03803 family)
MQLRVHRKWAGGRSHRNVEPQSQTRFKSVKEAIVKKSAPHSTSVLSNGLRLAAVCIGLLCAFAAVAAQRVQAQTFTVIHTFTDGSDGANPQAGLTIDAGGNLYGTALRGGAGYGTVFKLARRNSQWLLTPLYNFAGGFDGVQPAGRVTIGPDGALYGTTLGGGYGGSCGGCGTVFSLRPAPAPCSTALCSWTKTSIYRFLGYPTDGQAPQGDLAFDHAGKLYGITFQGGSGGYGTVYQLTETNGNWSEDILQSFTGDGNGAYPLSGVILDSAGNLYGTMLTSSGSGGQIYELTPAGSGWTKNDLYDFQNGSDGSRPDAGLIFDHSGNLYGAAAGGGAGGGGTAFELAHSNGHWNFDLLYSFAGTSYAGPAASLVMDGAGNLYGTTLGDGMYGYGSVFKLTRQGEGWTYTSLHDFTGERDGGSPYSSLVFDASGNLYGTTAFGGSGLNCLNGCGVVFEITP